MKNEKEIQAAREQVTASAEAKAQAWDTYLGEISKHGDSSPEAARAWMAWQEANGKEARAGDRLLSLVFTR